MRSRWKNYLQYGSVVVLVGLFIYLTFETYKANNMGFETKTYWDWLELLIIPLVLAIGAFFLNRSERTVERQIETDRQQEVALQTYLDRMAELLLDEDLQTTKKESVRNLARARTLTVLRGLNPERKRMVLLFLWEAGLIDKGKPIVVLAGADFSSADLRGVQLMMPVHGLGIDSPTFQAADLEGADLTNADLSGANLREINLGHAILVDANLSNASLANAFLQGAILVRAKLHNAYMASANLRGAKLLLADLTGANLFEANIAGVLVTDKQLAQAETLEGATMPNDPNYR